MTQIVCTLIECMYNSQDAEKPRCNASVIGINSWLKEKAFKAIPFCDSYMDIKHLPIPDKTPEKSTS